MNNYICLIAIISLFGILIANTSYGQEHSLENIVFLQTGQLNTDEHQFHISNELDIREFFNGKIIRVSGQTIEGFPYITYSKILDDEINTHGIIFVGGNFVKLSFEERTVEETPEYKEDDLQILVQYTQRIYSKQTGAIDVKIYDPEQNKLNDFNLNYGFVPNVNIEVIILDENDEEFYSATGITNDKGFFETEFYIPERYPRETLTITINVEDEDSESSKIFQLFTLGAIPDDSTTPPPP